LAAYKAKSENIKTEMDAINKIVPEYNVEKLFVPGLEDSERNLVIVKK
jgi:16S rRNA (guanine527-N7)-methyltransferase